MAPVPPGEEQSFAYESYAEYYTPQSNDPSLYRHGSERDSNKESPEPSKAKANGLGFTDYRPTALRWWFHLSLIVCLATAIGLTQYAIDSLGVPHALPGEILSNVTAARSVQGSTPEAPQGLNQKSTQHPVELISSQDNDPEDPNGSAVQNDHVQLIITPKQEPLEEDMTVLTKQSRHLPRAEFVSTKLSSSDLLSEKISTPSSPIEALGDERSNSTLSNDNARQGGNISSKSSSSNVTVGDDSGENTGPKSGNGGTSGRSGYIVIGKYNLDPLRAEPTGMGSLVDIIAGVDEPATTLKVTRLPHQDQVAELPPGDSADLDRRQASLEPDWQKESGLLDFNLGIGKDTKAGSTTVSTVPATHNGWLETQAQTTPDAYTGGEAGPAPNRYLQLGPAVVTVPKRAVSSSPSSAKQESDCLDCPFAGPRPNLPLSLGPTTEEVYNRASTRTTMVEEESSALSARLHHPMRPTQVDSVAEDQALEGHRTTSRASYDILGSRPTNNTADSNKTQSALGGNGALVDPVSSSAADAENHISEGTAPSISFIQIGKETYNIHERRNDSFTPQSTRPVLSAFASKDVQSNRGKVPKGSYIRNPPAAPEASTSAAPFLTNLLPSEESDGHEHYGEVQDLQHDQTTGVDMDSISVSSTNIQSSSPRPITGKLHFNDSDSDTEPNVGHASYLKLGTKIIRQGHSPREQEMAQQRSSNVSAADKADSLWNQPRDVTAQDLEPSVTIMITQETVTWVATEVSSYRTTTGSDGQGRIETVTTELPGRTSVVQSTNTVSQGITLVAQPSVMETIVGGITKTTRSTFSDAKGVHTSSHTTVIAGTPTRSTVAVMVTIPVHEGEELVTFQKVVPTTVGGRTQVVETISTDSQGRRITSSHTTVISGTPTSEIVWTVLATSTRSGETLVTIPTAVPVTIGRTTKLTTKEHTDSRGSTDMSTFTTTLAGKATSTTLWTIVGTPIPTQNTETPPNPSNSSSSSSNEDPLASETESMTVGITSEEYFLAALLPTILAVLIAFPIKLIGINARLMQPFHTLATADQSRGVAAEDSMFLRFYGWPGLISFVRALQLRQPIIAISDVLVLGAGLLAPLAAETISVYQAFDDCVYYCYGTLGVSLVPGRLLQALMSVLVALLLLLIILLSIRNWKTGVNQNPWSIAGMASLCLDSDLRAQLRSLPTGLNDKVAESDLFKALSANRYGLGHSDASVNFDANIQNHGIIVTGNTKSSTAANARQTHNITSTTGPKQVSQPFLLLTWWPRCIMLFVFASIMTILVYYENTSGETSFEIFMDSQSFGVKFFFTALGVIFGYSMETVFRCIAIMSPFLQLSRGARHAQQSILCSPPTNAFYGMWSAYRQRHFYLGFLSFTTLLAELLLPVTLSHVPFSAVETYMTQFVSAYLSVAVLGLMMIAIIWSFFIKWPHMPVDPRTIAGAMYYVCDSWMLGSLEGMSTLRKEDRDLDVRFMRHKYGYGCIGGMSLESRMGFDVVDDSGEDSVGRKRPH